MAAMVRAQRLAASPMRAIVLAGRIHRKAADPVPAEGAVGEAAAVPVRAAASAAPSSLPGARARIIAGPLLSTPARAPQPALLADPSGGEIGTIEPSAVVVPLAVLAAWPGPTTQVQRVQLVLADRP
jgi:hypothetical protein